MSSLGSAPAGAKMAMASRQSSGHQTSGAPEPSPAAAFLSRAATAAASKRRRTRVEIGPARA
eukprot:9129421-Lingulodinium_polyedra.AAC.1